MTEWILRPVSELCDHIIDCVNKTAPTTDEATPFKMLRTTNVRDGWVDVKSVRCVDEKTYERWTRRMQPKRGDVVLTREAPLGEVGLLRTDERVFLGQRLVMYRTDPTECDPRFLLYSMLGPTVQAELRSLGSGATVEHLRVPDCEKLTIPCPPLPIQRRIGTILGSLDDLIENNLKRIELLEQMTQTIYRDWFVRFRYPGHENDALVESSLGPIPRGWTARTIEHLVEQVKTTVDPTTIDPSSPAVGLEHIPRRQLTLNSWGVAGDVVSRKSVFKEGDLLFGKIRPYFHKVSVAPLGGICSTDVIVLRAIEQHWGMAVLTTFSDDFVANATQTSNGTKMPRADWKVIKDFPVAVPPTEVAQRFTALSHDALGTAQRLMLQGRRLAAVRDLLLPKLVTGRIDVSDLDLEGLLGSLT